MIYFEAVMGYKCWLLLIVSNLLKQGPRKTKEGVKRNVGTSPTMHTMEGSVETYHRSENEKGTKSF